MKEHREAIVELMSRGHLIGEPYVDRQNGRLFVVVDGVAMSPGDSVRLAKGQVTLKQLEHPGSN